MALTVTTLLIGAKITLMDNFDKIILQILKDEGGYVNNPSDPGGETNYGISKKDYPNLDIKNLTQQQAIDIYRTDYWEPQQYQNINDVTVAGKLFNLSVNVGPTIANKIAQRALRALGFPLVDDGILGVDSLSTINNKACPRELLVAIRSEAAGYYRSIVASNKSQSQFLTGWLNRAYE